MRTLNKWDIWYANVYFEEDHTQNKSRPVVIISLEPFYCISLKITSHSRRDDFDGEYEIIEWACAGLNRPSVIRAGQKYKLAPNDFLFPIGRLHPTDIKNLNKILSQLYPKD